MEKELILESLVPLRYVFFWRMLVATGETKEPPKHTTKIGQEVLNWTRRYFPGSTRLTRRLLSVFGLSPTTRETNNVVNLLVGRVPLLL